MQHDESMESISKLFKWDQALWLPHWNRLALEADGLDTYSKERLVHLFLKLDDLQTALKPSFDAPFSVHCAYRPVKYNQLIGGAHDSAHIAQKLLEAAVDFSVPGFPCIEVIKKILAADLLNKLGLRMENNGEDPTWIHVDTRQPIHSRYFIP